ncbi:MAG TPA: SDR family oxidoreductase [Verrucomicrobiae bacterium]|jgi:UDP-N-acetylglucosamine 4-epimerase|nr:SDR family oxidoreductase [Verrucomicrobiae bacterium]
MTALEKLKETVSASPATWLVTGAAGFIGSNLLETLLRWGQKVTALDNLSTGHRENLDQVRDLVGLARWKKCKWVEADVRDVATCRKVTKGVDYVLHQAALGSVPRSIEDPLATHDNNVNGSINLLWSARENGVKRFVFASSSSVYGDEASLPQMEDKIGHCLSPYAASKRVNELYAAVFGRCYGFESIGLRYFNVFGPRQDPNGAYAAVIPKWISAMIENEPVFINGDGSTSRDFCYVANVVQANLLAATVQNFEAVHQQYNIALGNQTSLNSLYEMIRERLATAHPHLRDSKPAYRDFRRGDIRHSQADIGKARRLLGYEPTHTIAQGLDEALDWYVQHHTPACKVA